MGTMSVQHPYFPGDTEGCRLRWGDLFPQGGHDQEGNHSEDHARKGKHEQQIVAVGDIVDEAAAP